MLNRGEAKFSEGEGRGVRGGEDGGGGGANRTATEGDARSRTETELTVEEIAGLVGGRLEGDATVRVRDIAPVGEAGAADLGFLAERKYLQYLARARPAALLVSEELAGQTASVTTRIVVDDPRLALLTLLERFYPPSQPSPGIHRTAVLGRAVRLSDDVRVDAYAVVGDGAEVGAGTRIGPHVVVGEGCRIGRNCVLHPHVTLYAGVVLGNSVIVHAGARLGVDGFGYVFRDGEHQKVPQVGRCVIQDHVEIGANACIDRGSIGSTEVGPGTKLDNLVHIGHNVHVGARVVMAAQAGVAGSSRIGDGAMLGGQAGISGHLSVGARTRVGGQSGVIGDVAEGTTVSGYPARPHGDAMRALGWMFRAPTILPDLIKRLRVLEREVGIQRAETLDP
ncbi:MAG: UDP-3-O-(3-hydroxymyristoyl)glucosamine N-acyltransferase [Gemmatimonadetes bacterium]|nr:UDP-3-O-(3-hydroxymyristoyl)glucosamine N-acyltransferase [Gemmatimonadota bacterium]